MGQNQDAYIKWRNIRAGSVARLESFRAPQLTILEQPQHGHQGVSDRLLLTIPKPNINCKNKNKNNNNNNNNYYYNKITSKY